MVFSSNWVGCYNRESVQNLTAFLLVSWYIFKCLKILFCLLKSHVGKFTSSLVAIKWLGSSDVVLLFKSCVGKLVSKTDLCMQGPAAAWERWEPGKALNCQMVGTQTSFRCWRKASTLSGLFKMKLKTAAVKLLFFTGLFLGEQIREWSSLLWRWP